MHKSQQNTDSDIQFQKKKRTIFNSDLSKDEIEAIQAHIETLDKDTDVSHGLYFEKDGFIYKFNTSLSQYANNRNDGHDGFEIIGKSDISKLNEEQKNRLKDVIENRGNIDSVLGKQGTWNEEGSLYDSDVVVTNGKTTGDNDRLDSQALQGESRRGRDNRNGGSNQRAGEVVQFQIGKKARTEFENKLRKARPDMSDAEIKATLDFLHELADEKENNAYIKAAVTWVANKSISLPQDYEKTRQIFDVARKKNVDIQKYKTFGELMSAPEMQKSIHNAVPSTTCSSPSSK